MENEVAKTEKFVIEARKIHGDKYNYSDSKFKSNKLPLVIICPEHGPFLKRPYNHIACKQGCPKCSNEAKGLKRRKTTEAFVSEARTKWGNRYDYSITEYIDKPTKIKFKCPYHGIIDQKPRQHLLHGCQYCNGRGISKHTIQSFVEKAKSIHGNIYDYSKVNFRTIHDKVTITCREHGDFVQSASYHINLGYGCAKCNGGVRLTNDRFKELSRQTHGDRFDYTKTIYRRSHDKIIVKCHKHGEFEQLAYMHLQTIYACPICIAEISSSKAESEIADFISKHYHKEIIRNNRSVLRPQEIDIFLPEIKLGIEFHGNYWHTERNVSRTYHANKADIAKKQDVKLVQIFEHEWNNKKEIVESRILSMLGKNKRIFARNTTVSHLKSEESNNFLDRCHIQGKTSAKVRLGLIHENRVVACITFGKPRYSRKQEYEMIRYASELNTNVVGGASKLLSYFIKDHGSSIISYSDRRWSDGNLYKKLGFHFAGTTNPGYFYFNIKTHEIKSRVSCQKHRLIRENENTEGLSETEIMRIKGFERTWDAGHDRWIMDN